LPGRAIATSPYNLDQIKGKREVKNMPYDQPIYEFDEEFDIKYYKAWVLGTQWFPPP